MEGQLVRGSKLFELSNHLGNVLATVSDKKLQHTTDNSTVDYYTADVISAQDYYSFGMEMPGRSYNNGSYRYGFNGKENDNEVKGTGNEIDYGMRVYDPRVGRFMSVDPLRKKYPELTPYQFTSNSPIANTDLDGAEKKYYVINILKVDGESGLHLPPSPSLIEDRTQEGVETGNGTVFAIFSVEKFVKGGKVYTTTIPIKTIVIPGPPEAKTDKGSGLSGDESNTEKQGYAEFGSSTSGYSDDQKRLPKAGPGSEILDLRYFTIMAAGLRGLQDGASPAEFLKEGSNLKKLLEASENVINGVEKAKEAYELYKKTHEASSEVKYDRPGDVQVYRHPKDGSKLGRSDDHLYGNDSILNSHFIDAKDKKDPDTIEVDIFPKPKHQL